MAPDGASAEVVLGAVDNHKKRLTNEGVSVLAMGSTCTSSPNVDGSNNYTKPLSNFEIKLE